jgi:hypothetical protein
MVVMVVMMARGRLALWGRLTDHRQRIIQPFLSRKNSGRGVGIYRLRKH